jgi:hypothetical protein
MSTKPAFVDAEIGCNVRNSAFHSVHPDDAASDYTFRSLPGSRSRSTSTLGGSSSAGTGTLFRKVKMMRNKHNKEQLRRQDTSPMTYQTGKNRLESLRRNQSPRNLDTVSEFV